MNELGQIPLDEALKRIRGSAALAMLAQTGRLDHDLALALIWNLLTDAFQPDELLRAVLDLVPTTYLMMNHPQSPLNTMSHAELRANINLPQQTAFSIAFDAIRDCDAVLKGLLDEPEDTESAEGEPS